MSWTRILLCLLGLFAIGAAVCLGIEMNLEHERLDQLTKQNELKMAHHETDITPLVTKRVEFSFELAGEDDGREWYWDLLYGMISEASKKQIAEEFFGSTIVLPAFIEYGYYTQEGIRCAPLTYF